MTTTIHTSTRTAARWAGLGYLAIFVLAMLANSLALESVVDPSDASATAAQLAESAGLVRLGTIAFLAIFLIDIVIAWALHVLLRDVHHDGSLLAAWFRLAYTVMLGVALVFLHLALLLVGESAAAAGATDEQVLLALHAFDFTWVAGLAAFGLHLGLVGGLLVRSGRARRLLGGLLMVAGIAYVVDAVAHIALPDYEAVSGAFLVMVAVPAVVAELGLTVWLLLIAAGRRLPPGEVRRAPSPVTTYGADHIRVSAPGAAGTQTP
jgi:hypothetical protein